MILQHYIGFCRMSTWISRRSTYVPSLLNLPLPSCPIPLLQVVTEPWFVAPATLENITSLYFNHSSTNPIFPSVCVPCLMPYHQSLECFQAHRRCPVSYHYRMNRSSINEHLLYTKLYALSVPQLSYEAAFLSSRPHPAEEKQIFNE